MSWPRYNISEVFDVARGGSPRPIQKYLTDDPDGLNWIMIGDASEGSKYITSTKNRIKPEGLKKSRMVHEGDFLLTNSMSFGRPYILRTSGCIHDGWLVLSPKSEEVLPDFFYHLLGSSALYNELAKRAAGAVVKNLNTSLVKSVQVPLPPLAEQKRIAGILDAADALRAKRRESLAQLDSLLQSTFLDMFGDPVTNPNIESAVMTELVSKFIDYRGKSPEKSNAGVPLITAKIVKGKEVKEPNEFIPEGSYDAWMRRGIPAPGDVIITTEGSPRRCCVRDPTNREGVRLPSHRAPQTGAVPKRRRLSGRCEVAGFSARWRWSAGSSIVRTERRIGMI